MSTAYNAPLPSWLSLAGNNSVQVFSGTPGALDVDDFTIVMTCHDIFGAFFVTAFEFRVWGLGFKPGYPRTCTAVCRVMQCHIVMRRSHTLVERR